MSFYVTLPSNASLDVFPDNTLTQFTTRLKNPLQLDGQYKVALTEIMFPINWKFRQDASIIVTENDKKRTEIFEIKFYAYDSVQDLFTNVNDFMRRKSVPITFFYNKSQLKASVNINLPWTIEFSNGLHRELGFKYTRIQATGANTLITANEKIYPQLNTINALYVYTDIVEHQYVGDEIAPLLRVVSVDNKSNFGDNVNTIYSSPHYVPVSRNYIETIRVDIRDDTGEQIQFSSGKVLLKLHFKPFNGL